MTLRIGLSIDPSMPRFLDVARQAERIGVELGVGPPSTWCTTRSRRSPRWLAVTEPIASGDRDRPVRGAHASVVQRTARSPRASKRCRMAGSTPRSGTSGPQVMEGWHGVPFDRPVQRTRETIEIVRIITARERLVLRRHRVPAAAARQCRAGDPFAVG